MTPEQFWQNFKLGQEQEIACNFIYDGLSNLHKMKSLDYETEIFPVLYYLSVGIERLLKVAVILIEFDNDTDINSFERSLITHNHLVLLDRIKNKKILSLGGVHTELLSLLSKFYKTHRYDRFSLQSLTTFSKDKRALLQFLNKHLQINIKENGMVFNAENSDKVKKFIGKAIKKITRELYSIIKEYANSKGLYTEEISSSSSKAGKVLFGDGPIVFEDEDISIIETLIFFLKTKDSSLIDFMKKVQPLSIDPALSSEYLQAILHRRPEEVQNIVDEVDSCYEEVNDPKERIEIIKAIKNPDIYI